MAEEDPQSAAAAVVVVEEPPIAAAAAMVRPPPDASLFKLWPPSDATRAAVRQKMALKLSSACFESQAFARIELADAEGYAKRIEEAAFGAAQEADQQGGEDGGSAVIMVYAKHASKLMLETIRSQNRDNGESVTPTAGAAAAAEAASRDGETASSSDERPPSGGDSVHLEDRDDKEVRTAFDVSGGTRAFLTKESAEELLRPLFVSGNPFTNICLSNWSFGYGSAEVASHALSTLKDRLVDVNLADIVAGRPEVEALHAMNTISSSLEGSKLKSLNLSDNALGEKGVRAFSALLGSQDSLQALSFMNNGISEEAARAISEILPSAKELRILRFHNNMSGDGGAEGLAGLVKDATLLEHFQFSSSRVGTSGGVALMEALRHGSSLRVIDIRDNMFGPEGGLALGQTLGFHTSLTQVYLSDLGLEDEGALAVIEALMQGSSQVEVLELGGNEITEKIAPALANCIRTMKHLTRLNLMENELKDKGAVTVSNAIKEGLENLQELDLSVNELGCVGSVAAAQAVANLKGFKLLNLNGNRISESGIDSVKEVLSKSAAGLEVLGSLDENEEEEDADEDEENGDVEDEVVGLSDLEVA